ncbi:MAG: nucleotidyltransferase domain-containing protein [Erysipelotrichaceae bacterium]|nr:nucleotidyltransferase domain-containing protein [Erysipelotrichaceae bacterium]
MDNRELITKISNELVNDLLQRFGSEVSRVVLYGSYARGDNRPDSDVDIIVLFNCSRDEVMKYRRPMSWIASDIGLENDVLVSIIIRDITTFENDIDKSPFYQNIVNEGVTLYGAA